MSSRRTLHELEAQKKRLELERRLIQVELELLDAKQEINNIRTSQTPIRSTESVEVPNVKVEEEPIFIPDEQEAVTEDKSSPKNSQSVLHTGEAHNISDHNRFPNLGTRKLLRSSVQTKLISNPSNAASRDSRFRLQGGTIKDPGSIETSTAMKFKAHDDTPLDQDMHPDLSIGRRGVSRSAQTLQEAGLDSSSSNEGTASSRRVNPFLTSQYPPKTKSPNVLRRKRSHPPDLEVEHSPRRQRMKELSTSTITRKRRKSSQTFDAVITNINKEKRFEQRANDSSGSEESNDHSTGGESGTPSLLAEAGDIDTEVPRAQRQRHIPQGGYQTPEYRRMTASERRQLELRYCVHILMMIQQKSCVRKPPLPLSKENLFDRCRRRFPDAVLGSSSTFAESGGALSFKQQQQQKSIRPSVKTTDSTITKPLGDMLKDGETNRLGEPLYRTANDFLDHVKTMLREYVRMGTCDNCPFAREGGKQSARVMCWRMRLESVIEERMRGLKTCMKKCDELAGDLEGRMEVVDDWFGDVEEDNDDY